MTEPPRPPGADNSGWTPPDPTSPLPSPASYSMPGEIPSPGYGPPPGPPTSGAGGYPPPTSGAGGYPPPTSGAGGYPPPASGGGTYQSGGTYQAGPYPPPPGGPYPPPGGPYPPGPGQPGYGAGGYYGAPTSGYPNADDKTWALIAHFGGAVGALISLGSLGFVGPLIAYLARGQQSPTARAHAAAALNFQIIWSIVAFVLAFFSWCLLFLPSIAVVIVQIVFGVIAGVKANEGTLYRYPMSGSFIK